MEKHLRDRKSRDANKSQINFSLIQFENINLFGLGLRAIESRPTFKKI
jgi:hypothetical protein